MRLDGRAFVLSTWLTLLFGTFSSTLVVNYYINNEGGDGLPNTFAGALWLVIGLWIGAVTAGGFTVLLGLYSDQGDLLWSVGSGYAFGALIRLMLLGKFLPDARNSWDFLWQALKFQDFPPYMGFVLLVLPLGIFLAVLAAWALHALELPSLLPPLEIRPRLWGSIFLLLPIVLVSLVAIRTLNSANLHGEITLRSTDWLTLPQTNMILAAIFGFVLGGSYACKDRFSAAGVMFMAAALHVMVMLMLDSTFASYDPFYDGIDPNHVRLLPFLFLWIGTPIIGAIAAFALHNLRDAFSLPPALLEESLE